MIAALTGYSRRRAASGDARALADLGDLLSWQDEFDAARDAYQQAVDLGHDRALLSLASLLREGLGDADGARAYLHRAIGSGDPDPLQSHYGAWVVCAERLGPFQVTGLASDGTVLTTLDYSFPRPSDDGS